MKTPSKTAKKRKKLRELVHSRELFQGMKPEALMQHLKNAVLKIDPQDSKLILQSCFHGQKQPGGRWSNGYCHCIAQVAAIVFKSAGHEIAVFRNSGSKKKGGKKGGGNHVPDKFGTHFVLKLEDERYFDPEAEPKNKLGFSEENYVKKNYSVYRLLSQWWYPSNKSLRLFHVVVTYCCDEDAFNRSQCIVARRLLTRIKKMQEAA
jgi:hypothetical protein